MARMGPLGEWGERTTGKWMKGVRKDERDGGGEKRGDRSGKKRRRRRDLVSFWLRILNCIYSPNYVRLTTGVYFFFQ